ncbi:hypothetical protein J3R83DRAFT_13181 [Lanmaoa asiatica]|nr:hypothetical protein J3R83DRAFT_13181 [Lanmaoa asiatica]
MSGAASSGCCAADSESPMATAKTTKGKTAATTAPGGKAAKDAKAKTAKKAALQGVHSHSSRKPRFSVTFRRPKTLRLRRNPKYPRKSIPHAPRMDEFRTIVSPLNTESAMKKIEEHNTLVFIVDIRSNKRQIKEAVKKLYDVQAAKVNTLIRPDGKKKAYVRLAADHDALDVANKLPSAATYYARYSLSLLLTYIQFMYPSFCILLLAALPSLVDASRSSFSNSHARRSFALKHRDPQGLIGGLGSVLSELGSGLSGSSTSSVLPPSSTYVSASSTPNPSCGGLFGPPCSSSSSTPSPTTTSASTTQGATTSLHTTTPTSSCGGLLVSPPIQRRPPQLPPALDSIVPLTSSSPTSQSSSALLTLPTTPSLSATPTTSCAILGVFGCTTLTPASPTSWSSSSTSSLPTSTVISFPDNTTPTTSRTFSSNPTVTTSYTSTSSNSISSNSNYNYLSTVSLLLLNSASPTTSYTASGPDLAPTTHSLLSVAPTASPPVAPLPSGLPQVILPQPVLNIDTLPSSDQVISVLFNSSLNWKFVAENIDSPGQIFEYLPIVIATALGIDVGEVQNYDLIVHEPTSYTGPADVAMLGTIWQGYIPSDKISTLASLISNQKSSFYTAQSGSIASTLAACVDPSLQLNAIAGPSAGGSSNTVPASSGSNVRQDAIIGVVTSLGVIAILIVAYVGYRAYKRRRALAHRRLSDNADDADNIGVRPDGQQFDQDSIGGQRRRSFYYAEDSLRGYQSTRADEDGYDHHVTNMRERPTRPVQPGTISTPILRESTMNW